MSTATTTTNPYNHMYVLPESEYKEFKRYKATLEERRSAATKSKEDNNKSNPSVASSSLVKCSICDREFLNANILAHHQKSHFKGQKCNICGKIFKSSQSLHDHLKRH